MKSQSVVIAVLLSLLAVSYAEQAIGKAPVKIEVVEKQIAAGAQVLDVRTEEEWKEGHLKDAVLVTVTEDGFLEKAKEVLDEEKPVVVYCRSGKRSAVATAQLREAGFAVYELEGGITAWIEAGKNVVKPGSDAGAEEKKPATEEEFEKLRGEIEQGRQSMGHIEAFVEMERAKLEENPDYEQGFMLEALEEQKQIREKIELDEKRLKQISK